MRDVFNSRRRRGRAPQKVPTAARPVPMPGRSGRRRSLAPRRDGPRACSPGAHAAPHIQENTYPCRECRSFPRGRRASTDRRCCHKPRRLRCLLVRIPRAIRLHTASGRGMRARRTGEKREPALHANRALRTSRRYGSASARSRRRPRTRPRRTGDWLERPATSGPTQRHPVRRSETRSSPQARDSP
jgi:hypothetical protein